MTGMSDEETRTPGESLHQRILAEFIDVGLKIAPVFQHIDFLSWLTSSFYAWKEALEQPHAAQRICM
jgi:hypothetical protein